jgi:hypothetical protein
MNITLSDVVRIEPVKRLPEITGMLVVGPISVPLLKNFIRILESDL